MHIRINVIVWMGDKDCFRMKKLFIKSNRSKKNEIQFGEKISLPISIPMKVMIMKIRKQKFKKYYLYLQKRSH